MAKRRRKKSSKRAANVSKTTLKQLKKSAETLAKRLGKAAR